MKTFIKTSIVAAFALAMATLGTSQARAGGLSIALGLPFAPVIRVGAPAYCYPRPVYYGAPYRCAYPYAHYGHGWGWGGVRHFEYHRR